MNDVPASNQRTRSPRSGSPVLVPILAILAGVVTVLTVAGVLIILDNLVGQPDRDRLNPVDIFLLMAGFIGGVTLAGGLLVLAAVLRSLRALENSLSRLVRHVIDDADSTGRSTANGRTMPTAQVSQPVLDEMVVFLRDLRDNSLLSDAQKVAKRDRLAKQEREALAANVESLVAKSEFHHAALLVADLEHRFGADSETRRLTREIEQVRHQTEASDVEAATRRIEDLLAISAWPRAEEIANALITRHPDSAEARRLANRIQRERHRAEEVNRQKELAEVQELTNRKQWSKVLVAARRFIEKYPDCPDSEVMRTQLETLQANAEVEERSLAEERIKALVRLGQFDEAIAIAQGMIQKYPNSPQAQALRSQLPRLQERAATAAESA
jgi:tetratricopeptide (TPR) repeat protein